MSDGDTKGRMPPPTPDGKHIYITIEILYLDSVVRLLEQILQPDFSIEDKIIKRLAEQITAAKDRIPSGQ
jgi:hypothetical protein